MKCLIFSDSHGCESGITKALSMHKDAEVVFFLGDGLSDVDSVAAFDKSRMWISVKGNCDLRSYFREREVDKTEEITLEGRKIVLTHGDLYGVKYGDTGIKNLALSRKADIVLFGHTHQKIEKYISTDDGGYYLFNPGSIGGGFGIKPSYGVINITEGGILLSHGFI